MKNQSFLNIGTRLKQFQNRSFFHTPKKGFLRIYQKSEVQMFFFFQSLSLIVFRILDLSKSEKRSFFIYYLQSLLKERDSIKYQKKYNLLWLLRLTNNDEQLATACIEYAWRCFSARLLSSILSLSARSTKKKLIPKKKTNKRKIFLSLLQIYL